MEEKKYPFDIELQVNDTVVLANNFNISFFNWESMNSRDFLIVARKCVKLIKDDLASKSRVASWFYNSPDYKEGELLKLRQDYLDAHKDELFMMPVKVNENEYATQALNYISKEHTYPAQSDYETPVEPMSYIFKFVIKHEGREMFSEIWDGSYYQPIVREHIDLINDPRRYESDDPTESISLKFSMYRAMSLGKTNVLSEIIRKICDVCRPEKLIRDEKGRVVEKQGRYATTLDYDLGEDFTNDSDNTVRRYEYGRITRQKQLTSELLKTKGVSEKNRKWRQQFYGNKK